MQPVMLLTLGNAVNCAQVRYISRHISQPTLTGHLVHQWAHLMLRGHLAHQSAHDHIPSYGATGAGWSPDTPMNIWCWLASTSGYLHSDTVSHQTFITVWWQQVHRFNWLQAALMTNKMQFIQKFEQVTINFHNHNYLSSIIIFPCHFMPH
jgi:hypothetical protein